MSAQLPAHWTVTVACIFIMFAFLAIVILGPKFDGHVEPDAKVVAIEYSLLAESIRQVENSRFDAIGKSGERSEWQIKPGTWSDHTDIPHYMASYESMQGEARHVATVHLLWIRDFLKKQDEKLEPYTVALCWNAGTHRFLLRECTSEQRRFAVRVENIYAALLAEKGNK